MKWEESKCREHLPARSNEFSEEKGGEREEGGVIVASLPGLS